MVRPPDGPTSTCREWQAPSGPRSKLRRPPPAGTLLRRRQFTVEALFETLRLAIELLAGHFHADLDFQHDAIAVAAQTQVLVSVMFTAMTRPLSSSDSVTPDQFPGSGLEASPGMMPVGNTGFLRGAPCAPRFVSIRPVTIQPSHHASWSQSPRET